MAPLSKPGFTRNWVQSCWGAEGLASVKDGDPVLCSGNAMGRGPAVVAYLEEYLDAVNKQFVRTNRTACLGVSLKGMDQGHHNRMAYGVLDPSRFTVTPYDQGPVRDGVATRRCRVADADRRRIASTTRNRTRCRADASPDSHRRGIVAIRRPQVYTAGLVAKRAPHDLKKDGEGYVLRSDGRRAALVHQFDRDDGPDGLNLIKLMRTIVGRVGIAARLARGEK